MLLTCANGHFLCDDRRVSLFPCHFPTGHLSGSFVAEPRRGIVLGAGGVLGAAWTMGALSALVDEAVSKPLLLMSCWAPAPARCSPASSRAGSTPRRWPVISAARPARATPPSTTTTTPPGRCPQPALGNDRLAPAPGRHGSPPAPHPSAAALSAMLRWTRFAGADRKARPGSRWHESQWPTSPQLWIVATDFETGRRTVFGTDGAPRPPSRRR